MKPPSTLTEFCDFARQKGIVVKIYSSWRWHVGDTESPNDKEQKSTEPSKDKSE